MTYSMLLLILTEAEARCDNASLPADVRERSTQTVSLCKRRMAMEGLTRSQLEEQAAAEREIV